MPFCTLKDALNKDLVPVTPSFDKPFVFLQPFEDRAAYCANAVDANRELQLYRHLINRLLPGEESYAAMDESCLAIAWPLRKLQPSFGDILQHRLTAHPLTWLRHTKGSASRLRGQVWPSMIRTRKQLMWRRNAHVKADTLC